jgi:D-alanyl-D-alanine carboxypeptidase/D-alanyl-D-alanine-endopeptidase (penicillin-binding protein 4)
VLCATCLAWALGPASASATVGLAGLRADFTHQLSLAGDASGAYVYDLTAKQPLFSERAKVPRPPASVEKLYTATTALALMGAEAHLTTAVLGSGQLGHGGVWEGSLYLRGGGDPTFGSPGFIASHYGGEGASVEALANDLVTVVGIHEITGSVVGDESYFDSLRGDPSTEYQPDPFLEGTLSGLAFNRGRTGSESGLHAPAAYAARELWRALKGDGVKIAGRAKAGATPPTATTLAQVESPSLSRLLGLTLPPSDNFFAETLIKDLGARFGGQGTTAAGAAVVRRTIAGDYGIHIHAVDGSGLSRSDATSPYQVTDLLTALEPSADGAILRDDLAIAGHTGTLSERMRGTAAAGRCEAKTGTLTGVSNLAGYCEAANGHLLAFAIFTDDLATEAARTIQDHMTITLASSDLSEAELLPARSSSRAHR